MVLPSVFLCQSQCFYLMLDQGNLPLLSVANVSSVKVHTNLEILQDA